MTFTNTPKPSAPSFTNTARVIDSETWATISTTWASETRTWLATISLMTNTTRVSSGGFTNTAKPS